ncbi:hypothetical protein ACSZM9_08800 [Aeromonas hydrophila]|uniref:hypothetical protein n=1 Tax=Aeromonas hydrophila TaxID=644 RepID=UPI003EC51DC1
MGLIWLNAGYDKSSRRDVMGNSNWGKEIEFEEKLERETRLELATPALASADHALPTECGSNCMDKLDL